MRDRPELIRRVHHLYGAAADAFTACETEILCESGAGTGKTFSLLVLADAEATLYQGARILFCKKTRRSLNEAVLVDWEREVLWEGHPAIHGTARRENRTSYVYPNGSEVHLVGMDSIGAVDNVMSSKWDLILYFEAHQATVDDWEKLLTRLRAQNTAHRRQIADTNPKHQANYLRRRSISGAMRSICYRHQNNPLLFDHDAGDWTEFGREYIVSILGSQTGVRLRQLRDHQWCSEEGMVYPMWDEAVHVHSLDDGGIERVSDKYDPSLLRLHVVGMLDPVEIMWTFVSIDWGYSPDPGAMQVWGVDNRKRQWLLAEVYRLEKTRDWWAERACELWTELGPFHRIVCDPSEKASIAHFNDRISSFCGRDLPQIAVKADNSVETGIALMRDLLEARRLFILRDRVLYGLDQELARRSKALCFIDEISGYTYPDQDSMGGRSVGRRPDPRCADHAMDAARYGAMWAWRRDPVRDPVVARHDPRSVMEIFAAQDRARELAAQREKDDYYGSLLLD